MGMVLLILKGENKLALKIGKSKRFGYMRSRLIILCFKP